MAYQKYEVSLELTFEAPTYPEDPNDVYELAELEKESIVQGLESLLPDLDILSLKVTPSIGE